MGITVLISFLAWSNGEIMFKSFFIPTHIKERKEYWRFFTHGFIHADHQHLIFNMITLFFFGPRVEREFASHFESGYTFVIFYFIALIASSIPSYFKHKDDYRYRSLGASGAVSAVLFASILFEPWLMINFFIPGFIFAIGYVWYSAKMSKQNRDNIGHDAHLWGGVFGLIFPILLQPSLIQVFLQKLINIPFI
jgi:membrane associated rhomboid family serine protease